MIWNILVPDDKMHKILAVFGTLSFALFTISLIHTMSDMLNYSTIVVMLGAWGIFTVWDQLLQYDK